MPPIDPQRRAQASELVAERFNRTMNASTSPRGFLCDLSMAALFSALPVVMIVRQAAGGDLASATTAILLGIAVFPIVISIAVSLSLRGAREGVIDWMAEHPFPLENVNSLLGGISDEFEVHFRPGAPLLSREQLQKLLDAVSEDTLATKIEEDQRLAVIKIGVIESSQMPLKSNYHRYERFRRLVDEVLVPLHEQHPVDAIRIL